MLSGCTHPRFDLVLAEGGQVIGRQCALCLEMRRLVGRCATCQAEIFEGEPEHRVPCPRCARPAGERSAPRAGVLMCPAQACCDGCQVVEAVCGQCGGTYQTTKRWLAQGRLYCREVCKRRAWRRHAKGQIRVQREVGPLRVAVGDGVFTMELTSLRLSVDGEIR